MQLAYVSDASGVDEASDRKQLQGTLHNQGEICEKNICKSLFESE